MKRLLVDHFTGEPGADGMRFGRPLQELLQRVEREVQDVSAELEVHGVGHEVIACNEVRSIRVLPSGDSQLNQLARTWETDLDGLLLVIAPLLFAIHGGAYGAFSPVAGLSPSEDDLSPDMLWLAERLPRYAILLRPDAATGVDADAFVLRHELDHARRCRDAVRGRAGIERAVITASGDAASHLLFGGKLEMEEVFVHAGDIAAARRRLLDAGVRAFPGAADPAHLAAGLRDGNPASHVLIAQLQMTAHVGQAIAEQALLWLPRVRTALAGGGEPVYKTCHGVLWGSLPCTNAVADGRLHLPLGTCVDAEEMSRRKAFATSLDHLESTIRDYRILLTWVTRTLRRFEQEDLAPSRFEAFLHTLQLPVTPDASQYKPLDMRHYQRIFAQRV